MGVAGRLKAGRGFSVPPKPWRSAEGTGAPDFLSAPDLQVKTGPPLSESKAQVLQEKILFAKLNGVRADWGAPRGCDF